MGKKRKKKKKEPKPITPTVTTAPAPTPTTEETIPITKTFAVPIRTVWSIFRGTWKGITAIAGIGGFISLYFLFMPNVPISPSQYLSPSYPFATTFTVTNNSRLSLYKVSSSCMLFNVTNAPAYTEFSGLNILDRNIPIIPELPPQQQQDVECPFESVIDPLRRQKPASASISIDVHFSYPIPLYDSSVHQCFKTAPNNQQQLVWIRQACARRAEISPSKRSPSPPSGLQTNVPPKDQQAFLQLDKVQPVEKYIDQKTDFPLGFNIHYGNKGTRPVVGAHQFNTVKLVTGETTQKTDQGLFDDFLRELEKTKREIESAKIKGVDIGVGTQLWGTVRIDQPLTETDRKNILAGNVAIYVLGNAYWKENPQGIYVCMRTQKATPTQKLEKMAWHYCVLSD